MRRSTRVRAEIPVRVRSLDPAQPFDILTRTLIVNAQGCGLHSPGDLPLGVPVELAIEDRVITGRILNSTAVDPEKGAWVAGIQLDKIGNVWGLPNPPADWMTAVPRIPPARAVSSHPFAKPAAAKPPAPAISTRTVPSAVAPAQQTGQVQSGTRKQLESLTEEVAAHLRARASADWEAWRVQAESAMRQLQQELANDLSSRIGERHAELQSAVESLSALIAAADQRRIELTSLATPATQAPPDAQDLSSAAQKLTAEWLRDCEEAMGGLRTRVEQLVAHQEAEVTARLAERQNEIVRQVETGAGKLDRLLAAADRALEQMEGWEQRSTAANEQLLHAAEAALEQIDARRASAQSALEQKTAASIEKLNAAVAGHEKQFDSIFEQRTSDYEAQAEAAGQRLEGKLAEGLNKLRQALDEDKSKHEAHLHAGHQKLATGMADLIARQEQIAAQIADLHKTKAEIESITNSLPDTIIAEVKQQVTVAWEQLRIDSQKMIAEAVGSGTRANSSLSEDVAAHARTLREQLAEQAGQMASELQSKIADSLSQRQEQIGRELQAAVEQATREFSQRAQSQADSLRADTEAVHTSALRKLEDVAQRSEHMLAESEAALYKSAEEVISSEIARARQQVKDSADPQVQTALARLRDEAARITAEHTAAATAAADRLASLQSSVAAEASVLEAHSKQAREAQAQLSAAAEKIVSGEIARAQQQIRDGAAPQVDAAISRLRDEASRITAGHATSEAAAAAAAERAERVAGRLQSLEESAARQTEIIATRQAQLAQEMQERASKAAEEISRQFQVETQRQAADAAARLQQLQSAGDQQVEALRKQIEHAQGFLNERTAEFRQSVHDAFLQAAGEIRGRVHSAVDTVDELIQLKSKEAIAGVESVGAAHMQSMAQGAEEVRRTVAAAQANAAATAEEQLQRKLAETLDRFREDAAHLAQSAASRWQSAMEETLRSFPELLRARLDVPPRS